MFGSMVPIQPEYGNKAIQTAKHSTYFSYFEILNQRWPNEDATALLHHKKTKAYHDSDWW
jgi:hypothetical protein